MTKQQVGKRLLHFVQRRKDLVGYVDATQGKEDDAWVAMVLTSYLNPAL